MYIKLFTTTRELINSINNKCSGITIIAWIPELRENITSYTAEIYVIPEEIIEILENGKVYLKYKNR